MQLKIDAKNDIEVVIPSARYSHLVEPFIDSKKDWLKKHLAKNQLKEKYYDLESGFINFLGKRGEIVFVEGDSKKYIFREGKLFLHSRIFPTTKEFELDIKKFAKNFLQERTSSMAKELRLNFNQITIREQRSRWGSCSSRGDISLNWKLIFYDEQVIDYVIVHELCHLREMNHSKNFWNLVGSILPEYKLLRRQLGKFV